MTTLYFAARGLGSSEVVKLGEIVVGEIVPFPGRRQKATWLFILPQAEIARGQAPTFEAARERLVREVDIWRTRAGEDGCVRVEIEEKLKGRDAQ